MKSILNKRIVANKQTQHQKQNQVVNVTINSSDGGGNGKKKKNVLQEAMQSIPKQSNAKHGRA